MFSHLFLHTLSRRSINSTRMTCVGLLTSWRWLASCFPALSRRTSLGCRTLILTSCLFISRCKVGQHEWPWGQLDRPRQPRLTEEEGLSLRHGPEVRVPRHVHPCPGYFVIPMASFDPVCLSRWSLVSATCKRSHFPPELRFAFISGCGGRWSMMETQLPICSARC